jgi:Protein of unknown function (DUF1570)
VRDVRRHAFVDLALGLACQRATRITASPRAACHDARVRSLLVAALVAAGCAHSLPGQGKSELTDRGWRAYTSAHFVVYTDDSDGAARQVVEELERATDALSRLAFPGLTLPSDRVDVVLLDTAQLHTLSGDDQLGGVFRQSTDVTASPHLLVAEIPGGGVLAGIGDLRETVLHEMTHRLLRLSLPRAPAWLHEGIASYWETLEIDGDTHEVTIGKPPPLDVLVVDWAPLAEVVSHDRERLHGRFGRRPAYAVAWGAVHYLYERSPEKLAAFEAALRDGHSTGDAWRSAIGLSPAALDQEMRQRYAADLPLARRQPAPPQRVFDPESVREVAPAEVHLCFARIAAGPGAKAVEKMRAQLDEAARLAPGSAEVLRWRVRLLADDEAASVAEAALADHADDPVLLAAWLEGRLHADLKARDLSEYDAPVARLIRAAGAPASSLALAARFLLVRGQLDEAQRVADIAVAKNGLCVDCLDALAAVRHARGDKRGAAEAERRALAAWPFERTPTQLLARLAEYEK